MAGMSKWARGRCNIIIKPTVYSTYLQSANKKGVYVKGDGAVHKVHHSHTLYQEELVPAEDDRLVRDLQLLENGY